MSDVSKDTDALRARIAQLEQALAQTREPTGGPLHSHMALLLGDATDDDRQASLALLEQQMNLTPLSLWAGQGGESEWQPIAGKPAGPLPPLDSHTRQRLTQGDITVVGTEVLVPVQVRSATVAVLVAPTAPEPAHLSLAVQVCGLIWEAHQRDDLIHRLRERDRRFRYAMEASRDGLWDWNLARNKVYFGRGYLRMLGYEYDELPGTLQTLERYFIHPDDLQSVMTEFEGAILNGRDHLSIDHRLLHRDGHTVWVNCRCIFVEPDPSGRATRCVGTNVDITQEVLDRQALIEAKAQAEQANQTKSRFLASMSHEIRTPMNAIIGLGHLLRDTELDEAQRSYLDSIGSAANTLLQTVNQVFDYAKLETGSIMLERTHFDLEQVFERLSRMFESTALHKPANIIFDIDDQVPRFMRGDATRLSHIISHLVTNALQYSQSSDVVVKAQVVSMEGETFTLRFSIIDYGQGIPPQDLDQLREDLRRQPHSASDRHRGFGLQICKLLVQLMNGTLEITSEAGKGSTFCFTAEFESSQIGERRIDSDSQQCQSLRLLVVDDNQLALDILARSAGKLVKHVDTASDAHQAIAKIRRAQAQGQAYDLLLLDYKMPLKNGLEAARDIKAAGDIECKPKVFLVSSFQRDEIFSQHLDSQFVDDFLSKPVSESRLFDAICRAMPECLSGTTEHNDLDNFANLDGIRVLLVEDNAVNRQVARGIMRKKGIIVSSVNDGQQAIDTLCRDDAHFDVVLMDIEMPVLDGIGATRQIRRMARFARLPIIAVTAQAMAGDREKCLASGMNDYICKPIKPLQLYQALSDLMDGQTQTVTS